MKAMAEKLQGEYEEWVQEQLENGVDQESIPDIWQWIGENEATAEEARYEQERDDMLTGDL